MTSRPREQLGGRGSLFPGVAAGTALLAVFQNFYRLSLAPLLYDETEYAQMGWRYAHWATLPASARSSSGNSNFEHPPLAKMLFGGAQLIVGHPSITASRAVCAACGVASAVVLFLWLRDVVDRWVGLLAGGILAVAPLSVFPQTTRFSRAAMLDPVAELFMIISVVLAWYWFRETDRWGWRLALGTGVAIGLATASKENAFLGAVGPLVLGVACAWRCLHEARRRLLQAAAAVAAAVLTLLACYLPLGDPIGRIRYLVTYQSRHSQGGHVVGLAGMVTAHPPWWANLWFAGRGLGVVLGSALLIMALAGALLRRDRLVAWCLAALAAPFVFHCFIAGVTLPFYWVMWTPPVVVLSALGVHELARRWRIAGSAAARLSAGLAAAAALLAMLEPSAVQAAEVGRLHAIGARAAADLRSERGLHGSVILAGAPLPEVQPLLRGAPVLSAVPADLGPVDTVLVGQPRCRTLVSPSVRALVQVNLQAGTMRLVRSDRLLRVYLVTGPLRQPSVADVAAEPVGRLRDHC